jgi:hypothetical protein
MGQRGLWLLGVVALGAGCASKGDAMALSKEAVQIPAPSPGGPRLGAVAAGLPVYERPGAGEPIGRLRLGGTVARSEKALGKQGCEGGWFAVYPRGVVCLDQGASLDLKHPALAAPAPNLEAPLPFGYMRTRTRVPVLEPTAAGTRQVGELMPRAAVAVLGATRVKGPDGKGLSASVLTDGRVLPTSALEPVPEVDFQGVELESDRSLPLGFIVKDSVAPIKVVDRKVEVQGTMERGRAEVTGKFHTRNNERYWALKDGSYVRNRDITLIHRREKFPEFVREDTRWIDVSVVGCTLVAYEGKKPVFATLVNTGIDRSGGSHSTQQGTFTLDAKYVVAPPGTGPFDPQAEIRDVPWAMRLSSGQYLAAGYWIPRVGILHGTGHILLSPADARWLWRWAGGEVPEGWLGADLPPEKRPTVLVRK